MLLVSIAILALLQPISADDCIDVEEHEKDLHKCCSYSPPYPREALRACQTEAEKKAEGDRHDLMACMFQCYFNALGIVNGDEDSLNHDKIAEYMQQLDENARNVMLNAYKECATETTGAVDVCNSYAMDIEICALQLFARRCPDELFNPSEMCDKVRSGVEFC